MPWEARLQFLEAVFFTFSGVGFLLDLANPTPGRTAHILFLVFMGGAIGVAYGFCFMRTPKLLPVLKPCPIPKQELPTFERATPHLFCLRKALSPKR